MELDPKGEEEEKITPGLEVEGKVGGGREII